MKSAAERLLDQCREPVTVTRSQSALDAYRIMRDGAFSQLPVVDDAGTVVGLVTSESILRAVTDRGAELAATPLAVAAAPPLPQFYGAPRLSELLRALREAGAALVVNVEGGPARIVTRYDVTEFFRIRSQELLWLDERACAKRAQGHSFFQALLSRLEWKSLPSLSIQESKDGRQLTFLRARHGRITLTLTFSFSPQRTSRIELHIDAPSSSESKRFFDRLAFERAETEAASGTTLIWDRLDRARGCCVSLSSEAFLSTNEVALRQLENWATHWVLVFIRVLWPRAVELAHEAGTEMLATSAQAPDRQSSAQAPDRQS